MSEENKGERPAPPAEPGDDAHRRSNRGGTVVSQAHIIAVGGLNSVSVFQDCVEQLCRLGKKRGKKRGQIYFFVSRPQAVFRKQSKGDRFILGILW